MSGLLRCGVCGGSYAVIGSDQWGCSTRREAGTCTNNRSIMNKALEGRVLSALRERMLQPDAIEAYVDEYQQSMTAQREGRLKMRATLEKREAEAIRRIKRLTLAIADGGKELR